jgi:hypothetical protein
MGLYILFPAAAFGLLSVLAIMAYMTGESLRLKQRDAVEEYVVKRTEALKLARQRERTLQLRQEKLEREQRALQEKILGPKGPVDTELNENIAYVVQVAKETPEVFAKVVKHYVQLDPAVQTGLKRATDLEDFEALDLPPPEVPASEEP